MVLIRSESDVEKDCYHVVHINKGESEVNSTFDSFGIEVKRFLKLHDSKWILCLIIYNMVIIYYLYGWITSTNSIALNAFVNTITFNIFALLVCLISVWASRISSLSKESCDSKLKTPSTFGHLKYTECRSINADGNVNFSAINSIDILNTKDNSLGTPSYGKHTTSLSIFGAERYEVLTLFVSSCLILLLCVFLFIKIFNRIGHQPNIHTGRLGLGVVLGILAHLGTILIYPDARLNHVVCTALPCPTFNGFNPILGGNIISAIILWITYLIIHFWNFHVADTAAAFAVIGLTIASMLPLAFYTSVVILQKVPHHMAVQLDRCLREALNIDGVVEFRNERFWMESFGKLAGSLHVRFRKNTNENHVIKNIVKHFSKIVLSLNVYKFPDARLINQTSMTPYPIEYYIDEILPHTKKINTLRLNQHNKKFIKINEFFNMKCQNNNAIQFKTFTDTITTTNNIHTITEGKIMTQLRDDKFITSNFNRDERTIKLPTIFCNENVRFNDYLYHE